MARVNTVTRHLAALMRSTSCAEEKLGGDFLAENPQPLSTTLWLQAVDNGCAEVNARRVEGLLSFDGVFE
jgi:hypothetical protein